jgi:hypothetical protein
MKGRIGALAVILATTLLMGSAPLAGADPNDHLGASWDASLRRMASYTASQ